MTTVEYSEEIEKQIIAHLDGWIVESEPNDSSAVSQNNNAVEPFITNLSDYQDNPNKRVKQTEVEHFYNTSLLKSYSYCNRLNIEDLSEVEAELFLKGVCLLTASDLWNKYNIRVNNEDLEDTYIQSYGGLLFKQAMNILNSFINQRITTLTSLKEKTNNFNSDCWRL